MVAKISKMTVDGIDISLTKVNNEDYICLTDMIKAKDGDFLISDWLRNKDTIEYIGTWESLVNPNFNYGEFTTIRNEAGGRAYRISIKDWVERTNAIGIIAKTGRYGGTYAHKDIAFNFGMWISPVFQLYIVKEYQRLKEIENNQYGLEWDIKRVLSKVNYQVQTDAIKNYKIPFNPHLDEKYAYTEEADLLNIALFGCTAKMWREANPERALKGENIRDMASINELAILSNIESMNATLIKNKVNKADRLRVLKDAIEEQRKSLDKVDYIMKVKKLNDRTFVDTSKNLSQHNKDLKTALSYNPKEKEPSE